MAQEKKMSTKINYEVLKSLGMPLPASASASVDTNPKVEAKLESSKEKVFSLLYCPLFSQSVTF